VGEKFDPFTRVGVYIPGGTAPLVSTALMTITLAKVAGCQEIVVTTPCGKDGSINPQFSLPARAAGATEIYRVGGAQAIAHWLTDKDDSPRAESFRPRQRLRQHGQTAARRARGD